MADLESRPTPDRGQVLAHRRSPAHDLAETMERGSGDAVRLREVSFLTQVAIRAAPDSPASARLEDVLGTSLPRNVGEVTATRDGLSVLWVAPDEFLAIAPDERESGVGTTEFADRLAAALERHRGQVVDVSANRTTFELSGPQSRLVLDKSVRIDLHPRVFPVGSAVVTHLGATPSILWRTGDQEWRALVRASFAGHVAAWLLDGMREYT